MLAAKNFSLTNFRHSDSVTLTLHHLSAIRPSGESESIKCFNNIRKFSHRGGRPDHKPAMNP